LLIKSEGMFSRYLNKPEATQKEFYQEWYKTGDFVSVNKDTGAYRILGRISQDIIKKAGYKISALDIESQILEMGSGKISEVCVLGIPDTKYGEEIGCVYAGSATADEI